MNYKNIILYCFKKNTYFYNFLFEHYKPSLEQAIVSRIEDLKKDDTLQDLSNLIEFRKRIRTDNLPFYSHNINQTNFRLYGISQSLFGNKNKNIYFLPSVEHGLIFQDTNWSDTSDTVRASCVTFGPFRKKILRRFYKTPIFEVGPYIQYADDYYTVSKFMEWKQKLGRTLLVFPSHGTNQTQINLEEKIYLNQISNLAKKFDSVLVCAFWWNLEDNLITNFSKQGYKIVSAGFREDPNFLRRLKTIIKLSDVVVCDSIGTHVGYCYSLGKNVNILSINTKYTGELPLNNEFTEKHKNYIKDIINSENPLKIKPVFDYYWGNNICLSKKELNYIMEITREITLRGKYWLKNYDKASQDLLNYYKTNNITKYDLLLKSLK